MTEQSENDEQDAIIAAVGALGDEYAISGQAARTIPVDLPATVSEAHSAIIPAWIALAQAGVPFIEGEGLAETIQRALAAGGGA